MNNNLILKYPDNNEEKISVNNSPDGAIFHFINSYEPGVYCISNSERILKTITVNLSPEESDLTKISKSEVDDIMKKAIPERYKYLNISSNIAQTLEDRGLQPYLINARFLKPFDSDTLNLIKSNVEAVVTIEENALIGGFGSRVAQHFATDKILVFSYGLPDGFIPHGATNKLKEVISFTPEHILADIEKALPFLVEKK